MLLFVVWFIATIVCFLAYQRLAPQSDERRMVTGEKPLSRRGRTICAYVAFIAFLVAGALYVRWAAWTWKEGGWLLFILWLTATVVLMAACGMLLPQAKEQRIKSGDEKPISPRSRSIARCIAAVAFFVAAAAFLRWTAWTWQGAVVIANQQAARQQAVEDVATPKPVATTEPATPQIGQTRIIGAIGSGEGLPCPASQDQEDAMIKSVDAHDSDGEQESMQGGSILHAGDKVLVLEMNGFAGLHMKLRVLSGPYAHHECYTEADADNLFR